MNSGFVGFGEERTASFAIDAAPIVTASYGPKIIIISKHYGIIKRKVYSSFMCAKRG